ncbi:MAG TPA: DUF1957 domain-containing protein, partial [Proteobacteria bacterium]|nr:DUF1957 domain-containing protein [Pseudomonadota bacterium]
MAEQRGYFALVLHAHLPYVLHHGRWPHGMDWLCEAASECYLPLLRTFERLASDGVDFKVTINLSPILCEQLAHPAFGDEFRSYLQNKMDAAREDIAHFERTGFEHRAKLARMWLEFYEGMLEDFEARWGGDILGAFARLWDAGYIEVLTSAATHGYLPLLLNDECVRAQVQLGKLTTRHRLGREPKGIWLPECAYRPSYEWAPPVEGFGEPARRAGIEEVLSDCGLGHFVVDAHLLKGGKAIGVYLERFEALRILYERWAKEQDKSEVELPKTPYSSYFVVGPSGRGAAVFGRDPTTSLQVWSAKHGYPGDFDYLEFHKKSFPGGLRYWRITDASGDLASKQEYVPEWADGKVGSQAEHFIGVLEGIVGANPDGAIIVSPYDAELFGHWWFEGPRWIAEVYRRMQGSGAVKPVTLSEYLELHPPTEAISLPEGSWGEGGHHWIWLNPDTEWTWKLIYAAERTMVELA